ncbi:MAG: hypothetical protein B7Y33_02140 [Hydrogenophilales bacterium 16-62-9]|nr:MAG: hypothetical protein B7Y33_02140 [Hydrogenophilales bacterium 16-62-9]
MQTIAPGILGAGSQSGPGNVACVCATLPNGLSIFKTIMVNIGAGQIGVIFVLCRRVVVMVNKY